VIVVRQTRRRASLLFANSTVVVFSALNIQSGLVGPSNYYTVQLHPSEQMRKHWIWYAEDLVDTTTAYKGRH
jgi:hypothetical protein